MTYDVLWLLLATACVLGLLVLALSIACGGTRPASDKLAEEAERWEE